MRLSQLVSSAHVTPQPPLSLSATAESKVPLFKGGDTNENEKPDHFVILHNQLFLTHDELIAAEKTCRYEVI